MNYYYEDAIHSIFVFLTIETTMKKTAVIIFILLTTNIAFSQSKIVANQLNSWWTYGGNHRLSDKWSVHTLYSHRRNDFTNYLQQSLVRVGLNYHANKNLIFTFGGDWVITYPYGEQPIAKTTTTYRSFEQMVLKNKVNRFYFKHRYKLEQQYTDKGYYYKVHHRFRYRFGMTIPLNHKTMEDKTIFLTFFDEVFINFGKETNGYYFNQNWAYAGLGFKINKSTSVALGYMNQYFPKSNGLYIENNHTFSVNLNHSLDFRKKE